MRTHAKLAQLLSGSAVALALAAAPVLAQTAAPQQEPPPAASPSTESPTMPSAPPAASQERLPAPTDGRTDAQPGDAQPGAAETAGPAETIIVEQAPGQLVSTEVIGTEVYNPSEESIGKITGLLFDENERIIAGIVSVGGFLGLGAKNVAVNWDEIRFTPGEDVAVATLSREQLEAAPAFVDLKTRQAQLEAERQQMEQTPPAGGAAPPAQ